MNRLLRNVMGIVALTIATQAAAQITFYEHEDFRGRSFTTKKQIGNFEGFGFNDRASSAIVDHDQWEVCEYPRFKGRCVILHPGKYPSLASIGFKNRVSSVRNIGAHERIGDRGHASPPSDFRRRHNERLFEANVLSVRAVVGPPEQRCWIEREKIVQEKSNPNVPGAIAGALIGGILGHQVGGGTGKDLATVGGVIGGAAIGANIGRDNEPQVSTKDVQHCTNIPSQAKPEFWDVIYDFRGIEHHAQMTAPPGATVTVNLKGEPRE